MTKSEFMKELETLLVNIPQNEKKDAIQYYNDYFADGNISDDMDVPISIGTPRQVAEGIIKEAGYSAAREDESVFNEDREKENTADSRY